MTLGLVIGGIRRILRAAARTSAGDIAIGENSSILGRISSGPAESCGERFIGELDLIIDLFTPFPLSCFGVGEDAAAGSGSLSLIGLGDELAVLVAAWDDWQATAVPAPPFRLNLFELDGMMPPEITSNGGLEVTR